MAGDVIVGVNDESMKGSTSDVVASKIRGEAGTTVKVSVLRDKELKEFNIVRAKVNNPSVRWEIKDNVGVIIMNRFDSEAASSTRAAAKEFKSKGVKAVVLDLRDNGGGYLDAARDVASIWLKDKVIVTEKSGDTVTGTERSSGDPILEGVKTVVVVNGGSASASEIVAGALQEYGAATIVGEKTFGKGSVQQIINLADGRILKVTIAKWYTPKGKNITKEGITPDKTVIMTAADTNAGKDPQMDVAVESIN
jgi:carboxyl-terminal processing protease